MGLMDKLGIRGSGGGVLTDLSNFIPGVAQFHSAESAREAGKDANATNIALAREAQSWSSLEAQKQMDFQERMSNTSYQRQAKDMAAAGLNPLLGIGAGASTPGGAMGSAQAAHVQATPMDFSGLATGAMDAIRLMSDVRESSSRRKLNVDAADAARARAGLDRKGTERMAADAYIEGMKKKLLERVFNSAKKLMSQKPWDGKSLDVSPSRPDQGLIDLYGAGGYE